MQGTNKIPFVSSEIVGIWNGYMNDSMAICVLKHFINTVEDADARPIIQYALDLSSRHIPILTNFFNQEGLPVPDGFKENDDLNPNAPRIFDDAFYLIYLSFMARVGMKKYADLLSSISHPDLRMYFSKCINESVDLYNKTVDCRLSKGLFIKAPQIDVPNNVEYVEDKNFIFDWFGEKRRMIAREISHTFANMIANTVGRAVSAGFGQVSKNNEVAEYIFRGKDLTNERIKIFSEILLKEDIPIPSASDSYLTRSTTAPFSEKLMMFHIISLASVGIINYGTTLADNLRSDIQAVYARLISETLKYMSDGAKIMVKNRWMEQPPQAIKHESLVKV